MKLLVSQLPDYSETCTLIVESLDASLYQAFVVIDGHERLIHADDGKPVRAFSVGQMRERLGYQPFRRALLRQRSAYDEMIGQPRREHSNALEVEINWPGESGPELIADKRLH